MMRTDHAMIAEWVSPDSRVLDLGCGDGALLQHLSEARNVTGYGIEIDEAYIPLCVRKGINVIQSNLDDGLADFEDGAFDHVILSLTLQSVVYPDRLLDEMLRVGTEGIVSFPNFAHWKPRLQLALGGRMPVSETLPHDWYNTPNIHLCTLKDFEKLCDERGIRIVERRTSETANGNPLSSLMPNLFGEIALYRFTRR